MLKGLVPHLMVSRCTSLPPSDWTTGSAQTLNTLLCFLEITQASSPGPWKRSFRAKPRPRYGAFFQSPSRPQHDQDLWGPAWLTHPPSRPPEPTRCSSSPSIHWVQPRPSFSPFCTHSSLSPSQLTVVCRAKRIQLLF